LNKQKNIVIRINVAETSVFVGYNTDRNTIITKTSVVEYVVNPINTYATKKEKKRKKILEKYENIYSLLVF
jgi:hypothetical protein